MKVSIYSLQKVLFEGEGRLLNCKTMIGEITILNHHRLLISELVSGVIKVIDSVGKEHFFNVKGGFLEVKTGNEVRALVDC